MPFYDIKQAVFAGESGSILLYSMTASYLATQNAEQRRAAIDRIEDEDCSPSLVFEDCPDTQTCGRASAHVANVEVSIPGKPRLH